MHSDTMVDGRDYDVDPLAQLVAPDTRHPGDVVRVLAGFLVLVITVLAVHRDRLSAVETDRLRLIDDLPSAIAPYLDIVMQAGNVLAGPVLALLVLAIGSRRRWRQAIDLAVAATLAWVAAKVVKNIIQRPRPGGLLEHVARIGSDGGLGFVSGHTAVAAALATAAAPHLARNARRAVDPDTRDRDLIVRVARLLAFRDVRDEAAVLDAPAQANHEAAMSLLARQHGARVPTVRAIARHHRHGWLVLDHVPGKDLRRVASATVTDEFLHQLWAQLSVLREAGIAHRDLVASNILVDAHGSPRIVDFAHAESSPRPQWQGWRVQPRWSLRSSVRWPSGGRS